MAILRRCIAALLLLTAYAAQAQARFDLPGPKIDVRVTRDGILLPIASVPNLQPGDELWLHPDLPPTQSVHYLLIAAFLRGTTNPPPDNWFTRIETWDRKVREEGITITVPAEAQQAILFLAPETGGDFSTLRSAVKGRPGIFVRASQDLAEAGFEQGRIEKYLAAMKNVPPGDPKALQEHSDLLARTLNLRPNPDCFKRPLDQQYTCLTQTGTQLLLDDGHAQTVAAALSNGPGSDLINQASYTQLAGGGTYSAYVGAIVDLIRLTSGLHTAKYQYIPAISFPTSDATSETLDLRLNTPPSFNNPKSVIVIGLPAVQKTVPPPLRPVDPNRVSCLLDPHVALPIEGAPLVFSTAYAHDIVLHLNNGSHQDIPLLPNAYQGGLVLAPNSATRHELTPDAPSQPAPSIEAGEKKSDPNPSPTITGTVQGSWGFDHFTGPTLPLQQTPGGGWHIVSGKSTGLDPDTLIVGRPNHLQLLATGTACVQSIALEPADTKVEWKLAHADKDPHKPTPPEVKPEPIDVALTLPRETPPGSIHLTVHQFGSVEPEIVGATAFVEPSHIENLQLHSGDTSAILTGASLDQVKSVTLKDLTYVPRPTSQSTSSIEGGAKESDGKSITLTLPADAKPPTLRPSEKLTAEVHLRDGRTLPVSTLVLPARPAVTILSRRVSKPATSSIELGTANDLALGSQLVFFLKSKTPFPRTDTVEIAAVTDDPADNLHTTLNVANGSLVLQDTHTVLATFDPLKTFGPSTFGPFRLRPVAADGTPGDWIPLATIVRLPTFTSLICPADPVADCTLSGSALYLIDSLSLDHDFTTPIKVSEGFVETSLAIPHPPANLQPLVLYLRLRDDPASTQQVTISVQSDTPTPPPPRTHGAKPTPVPASTAAPTPPPAVTEPQPSTSTPSAGPPTDPPTR